MELQVRLLECVRVAAFLAGQLDNLVCQLAQAAALLLRGVDGGEAGGGGLDGVAEFAQRRQLGRALLLSAQAPGDNRVVEHVPLALRQNLQPHAAGRRHKTELLERAHRLAGDGAGDAEALRQVVEGERVPLGLAA